MSIDIAQQAAQDGHKDHHNSQQVKSKAKSNHVSGAAAVAATSSGGVAGALSSKTSSRLLLSSSSSSSPPFQAPQFDYLVPINICITTSQQQAQLQEGQQPQQPSLSEQPLVESITWSLFNRVSGQVEWSRSVRCFAASRPYNHCQSQASHEKQLERPNSLSSLGEAIQQIDASLAGKNFVLVTCGPAHLRQHLHPIAKRLKVELGPNYNQYADLLKEFDRCSFRNGTIIGRQVGKSAQAQQWNHNQQQQQQSNSGINNENNNNKQNLSTCNCSLGNLCCCNLCCTRLVPQEDSSPTSSPSSSSSSDNCNEKVDEERATSVATTETVAALAAAAGPQENGGKEDEEEDFSEKKQAANNNASSAKLANECEKLRHMQQVSSSGSVCADTSTGPAVVAPALAMQNEPLHCQSQSQSQLQQQQQQQISLGTRKRFDEILKCK